MNIQINYRKNMKNGFSFGDCSNFFGLSQCLHLKVAQFCISYILVLHIFAHRTEQQRHSDEQCCILVVRRKPMYMFNLFDYTYNNL